MNKFEHLLPTKQEMSAFKIYGQNLGLAIIGLIAFASLYGIIIYFREILVTYLKSFEDRGHFYKWVELRPTIKRALFFTGIMGVFWITILNLSHREFVITTGLSIFSLIYLIFLVKYYIRDQNDFDLFDDEIYLYNKLVKSKEFHGKEKID
jgi:hypothetical protein